MNWLAGDGPIVIVDDSESDLMIARRCYERSSLERAIVILDSGEALIDHLEQVERGQQAMPSLVLLDINMPTMSGFDALQRVRLREAFQQLPVIVMLTNSDNPKDIDRAQECGADGFQVKPMRMDDYVAFFDALEPRPANP